MYETLLQKKAFKKAATMTNNQAIGALSAALKNADYPQSYLQELISHLALDYSAEPLSSTQASKLQYLLFLISQQTPIEYIVGKAMFFGRYFKVNRNVLIPRFDTEKLIEQALKQFNEIPRKEDVIIIDIGTGSGAIAVTMALETTLYATPIIAIDDSDLALSTAKGNATSYEVNERIQFIKCRDFPKNGSIPIVPSPSHIIVIANPPYIQRKHFDVLPASVRNFEPEHALLAQPLLLKNLLQYLDTLVSYKKSVSLFLEYNDKEGKMIQHFCTEYKDATCISELL